MTNALRKSRKTSITVEELHDHATGMENACEARCLALATETVDLHGRPFRFCGHHANKVRQQAASPAQKGE